MVDELRRRTAPWLLTVQWFAPAVVLIITLLIASLKTHSFNYSISDLNRSDLLLLLAVLSLAIIIPLAAALLRVALKHRLQPNRAYPEPPDAIPGAPRALKKQPDGTTSAYVNTTLMETTHSQSLGYERREPDVLPGGWITVQLVNLIVPPVCAHCLAAVDSLRVFSHGGNALVRIPLPICRQCVWKFYQQRLVRALLGGAIVASPGILWLIFSHSLDDHGVMLAASAIVAMGVIGIVIGWNLATAWGCPARFRRYSAERNTIEIRFKNPAFAEIFRSTAGHQNKPPMPSAAF